MTVDECRRLMGRLAEGKTDEQIEAFKNEMTTVANEMASFLESHMKVDREMIEAAAVSLPGFSATSEEQLKRDAIDRVRWTAYAFENPDDEDAR